MNALPKTAINPLKLADKLASIRNRTHQLIAEEFEADARRIEALWFIQAMSAAPGGLDSFARRMTVDVCDHFVTSCMAAEPKAGRYTFKQLVEVWDSLPLWIVNGSASYLDAKFATILKNSESVNLSALRRDGMERQLIDKLTPDFFAEICRSHATSGLPDILRDLCLYHERGFANSSVPADYGRNEKPRLWWCANLEQALFAMMDKHARQASERIAQTSVVKQVWDALDYAWHSRGFVTIEGNTRFGKSEAVRVWCEMYPGRARYLAAPHSSSEKDLLSEVAGAFHLPYTWTTPEAQLREEIGFILKFGGIGLVVDEGHFMVPTRYTKRTSPHRLNWFRTQLVDRRVMCAICFTGQFTKDLNRYTKSTGYVVDQWLGRPKLRVKLPDELPEADELAVARKHLDWCSEATLLRVMARAEVAPSFLKAMEDVADRARWLATKERRKKPTEADAIKAMEQTLPEMASLLSPDKEAKPDAAAAPRAPSAQTSRGQGVKRADYDLPSNRLAPDSLSLVPAG